MLQKRENEIISERDNGTKRVMIVCGGESKVEQQHQDKCNINTIMAKATARTHIRAMERAKYAKYGDFSNGEDYHSIRNKVLSANAEFMNLPSELRKKFNNDPGELLDFLSDPENRTEAEKLGLVEKQPIVEESPAEAETEPKTDSVETKEVTTEDGEKVS